MMGVYKKIWHCDNERKFRYKKQHYMTPAEYNESTKEEVFDLEAMQ